MVKCLDMMKGSNWVHIMGKMIEIVFPNLDGIKFVLHVGNALILIHISFDGSNGDNIGSILVWDSLGFTDGKMLESDEVIILWWYNGKLLGIILGNVDGIFLGLVVETELWYIDVSFDGSNDENLEGLLIRW